MKVIDCKDFKEYLVRRKEEILSYMRQVGMPKSKNPFSSLNDSRDFVELMSYEEPMETVLNVITEDQAFHELQASGCLIFKQYLAELQESDSDHFSDSEQRYEKEDEVAALLCDIA